MLFSDGFRRGFHHRPAARVRSGSDSPGAPCAAAKPPDSSCGASAKPAPRPTIVRVRDKSHPGRQKTIITLQRAGTQRAATAATTAAAPAAPSRQHKRKASAAGSAQELLGAATEQSVLVAPALVAPQPPAALVAPDSPASTLLSVRKNSSMQRSDSYHSLSSSQLDGSQDTCDTALTQIDDGLSDWGLPKVIDPVPHELEEGDMDVGDMDVPVEEQSLGRRTVLYSALEASLLAHNEPPNAAPAPWGVPSLSQRRMQRVLVVLYTALLLTRRGVVPPRYRAQPPAEKASRALSTKARASLPLSSKPAILRFSPFASWV